ncbi:MAG: hypothetical protein IPH03_08945 [Tetrasphaera sp.]|nr:hypothetical protein [Tetrasphaera sp.]
MLARVVWFSTVGSVLARRVARRNPGAVVVCHNDALVGDVYVNHGVVVEAMRQRGQPLVRLVRNPLHPFTVARDAVRYRSARVHQVVVNLTAADDAALRRTFRKVRPRSVVIGNGVDPERFRPPTADERGTARDRLQGLADDDRAVLFVGHEFDPQGVAADRGRRGRPTVDYPPGRGRRHSRPGLRDRAFARRATSRGAAAPVGAGR